MFCYFGAMRDFSSNETPHFPARLFSLFLWLKTVKKNKDKPANPLNIRDFPICLYYSVWAFTCNPSNNMGTPVKLVSERLGHEKYRNESKDVFSPL